MAHTRGVNLKQIHPPDDTVAETDIDIIAIHGLDTKSPDTWTWRSKDLIVGRNVNWLADPNMLPSIVGQARIFTCDWPSEMFETADLVRKRIEEYAVLLLDGIRRRPPIANARSQEDRPIVFIASCLGGIILIKALVMAGKEYHSLRTATQAIVFLATPFGGTSFQDVASWAEPSLKVWASIRGQKVTKLLDSVKGSTFDLGELVRAFTRLCLDDRLDRVMTFYELGKTNLYHKVFPFRTTSSKQLVDRNSATLQIVPAPLPLDRPHNLMNKFSGPKDLDYITVAGKIEQFLHGIREGRPLKQADDWIRNRHYTAERLRIERLSGQSLSMEQCYINLAIVENLGKSADGTGKNSKKEGLASRSSPFTLLARQKVKTPEKAAQVELQTLFDPRKLGENGIMYPRRILIRGRAGVGKTTLCKKIVHEFYKGTWGEWNKLFDRVLWIPLRNLKLRERCQVPGYNFQYLFRHEYFSQSDATPDLAKVMSDECETKNSKTLFLLDGLDEVSHDMSGDGAMASFLRRLLDQTNVIITSRPSANITLRKLDLELETIGFYPDQVKDYIQNSFIHQETRVANADKAHQVQSFVEKHWLIQGLVRIPIQLDALCYTWEDFDSGTVLDTMTGIYQAIEQKLWKKDAVRLGKSHDGELLKPSQLTPSEAQDFVQDEVRFLEGLAFTGLYNNMVDFTPKVQQVIFNKFKQPGMLLNKTLPHLSFLRTPDPSSKSEDQDYHFIHLTFQEYFAARYFVRQWNDPKGQLQFLVLDGTRPETKSGRPVEFLERHKYTAGYDIFWRFVAGLLDATEQAGPFIDTIEKEPLDLLGPTHQRLLMHCCSEISGNLSSRARIEEKLSQWICFEAELTRSSLLARESECPEECVRQAIESSSGEGRSGILQALSHRRTQFSEATIVLLTALLKDADKHIRSAAAATLHRQHLSDTTVTALAELIKDSEGVVRRAAAESLRQQKLSATALMTLIRDTDSEVRRIVAESLRALYGSNLTDDAVKVLMLLLEDKEWNVRYAAAVVLGGLRSPNLSQATAAVLTALFKNRDGNVRRAAAEALGRSTLTDASVMALVALLRDTAWEVRHAATHALGLSNMSEATAATLTTLLKDNNDSHVQRAAAETLCRQNLSETIVEAITALLRDTDGYVRSAAAKALGGSNLPEASVAALTVLLSDENGNVRSGATKTLCGKNLLEATVAALAPLLKDKLDSVRCAAASALGGHNLSEATVANLVLMLKDSDEDVRCEAAAALGSSNLSEASVVALTALLKDEDRDVRSGAATALGCSNLSEGAITGLALLLKDSEDIVQSAAHRILLDRKLSESAAKALTALLQDPDEDVQCAAALALVLGGSNLVTALTLLLNDTDWLARFEATELLGHQSNLPEATIIALTVLLRDSSEGIRSAAAQTLGGQNLTEVTVNCLVASLKDADSRVRYAAAGALGNQKLSETTVAALVALLNDTDKNAQAAAATAIGNVPNLVDKILQALGLLPESERKANTKRTPTLLNVEDFQSLYSSLLRCSFQEQVSLYFSKGHDGDDGANTRLWCIINQPNGIKTARLEASMQEDLRSGLSSSAQAYKCPMPLLKGEENR